MNWPGRAFRVFGLSAGLSCSVGGAVHEMAAAGRPVGPPALVSWMIAVFAVSLTGATITAIFLIFAERRVRATEVSASSLVLTLKQARRMSRDFERAGVHMSPARLRAISAGAPASDAELVNIEFALIATEPDYGAFLNSNQSRRG